MDIFGIREQEQIIGCKCDTCGKSTETGEFIPIRVEFSYGHPLDGEVYDFCNDTCLIAFIVAELKKETK